MPRMSVRLVRQHAWVPVLRRMSAGTRFEGHSHCRVLSLQFRLFQRNIQPNRVHRMRRRRYHNATGRHCLHAMPLRILYGQHDPAKNV